MIRNREDITIEITIGILERSTIKPILSFPIIIWPKINLRLFSQSFIVTSLEYHTKVNIFQIKTKIINISKKYFSNETTSVDTLSTTTRFYIIYATGTRYNYDLFTNNLRQRC